MSKQIKILHMFRELEIGGIQTLIGNIYNNIDQKKIEFDFLVSSPGILDEEYIKKGSKIHYIPYITKVGPIKYKQNLINFFKNHQEYKIVHIHFDKFSGLIAETAKKCGIKTIICHSHTISNETNLLGKIYKNYLQSKIIPNATLLFACSEKAAKYLFKKNYKQAQIIYNGIDLDKFKYNEEKRNLIRNKYKIKKTDIIIGCVGRLSKEKNHIFLLKIFKELMKKNSNYKLMIVGDGEKRDELIKAAKKYKVSNNVIFTLAQKNTNDYYSAMDIFVLPSLHEGLGIVLIEAQASGLPCITSKKIPKETKISQYITYLNNRDKHKWTKAIEETTKFKIKRNNQKEILTSTEYDIKNVANKISQIYLNEYNNN